MLIYTHPDTPRVILRMFGLAFFEAMTYLAEGLSIDEVPKAGVDQRTCFFPRKKINLSLISRYSVAMLISQLVVCVMFFFFFKLELFAVQSRKHVV